MSFRRATATKPQPDIVELERELRQELIHPSEREDVQPIIRAEPAAPAPITRLVVVWDAWADLDLRSRSEVIMNAYASAFGLAQAASIVVAMGLTATEAARMGVG